MKKGIAIFAVLGVCAAAAVIYQNHLNNTCELSAANVEPEPDMVLQEPVEENLGSEQLFSDMRSKFTSTEEQQNFYE
ncbi:MAG: hypothetical protein K6F48_11405 [Paludibacteraceae bacterium]|nr:hypothetical protein [Paludibacteraceae bacterium]